LQATLIPGKVIWNLHIKIGSSLIGSIAASRAPLTNSVHHSKLEAGSAAKTATQSATKTATAQLQQCSQNLGRTA